MALIRYREPLTSVVLYRPPWRVFGARVSVDEVKRMNVTCLACGKYILLYETCPRIIGCGHKLHFECQDRWMDMSGYYGCNHCRRLFGDSYHSSMHDGAMVIYHKPMFGSIPFMV